MVSNVQTFPPIILIYKNGNFVYHKLLNQIRSLKKIESLKVESFFLGAIYLVRVVIPSPKRVKNLPKTYEKLHFKWKPYQFGG